MTTKKETDDEKEIIIHNETKINPMPEKKENKNYIQNPIFISI